MAEYQTYIHRRIYLEHESWNLCLQLDEQNKVEEI